MSQENIVVCFALVVSMICSILVIISYLFAKYFDPTPMPSEKHDDGPSIFASDARHYILAELDENREEIQRAKEELLKSVFESYMSDRRKSEFYELYHETSPHLDEDGRPTDDAAFT